MAPVTVRTQRTVALVVESGAADDRLRDLLPLFENDLRIQTVQIAGEGSRFAPSGRTALESSGGLVLPWNEALRHRFDLGVAAHNGHNSHLERISAPMLVLPHGMGFSGSVPPGPGFGPPLATPPTVDAVYSTLVRYGRVTPAALGVAHRNHKELVTRVVPEAEPICHVVGSTAYDRAVASASLREDFRRAAGVEDGQRLVVLSSTWGPNSLVGSGFHVVQRLMEELPRDHKAALLVHPGVWSAHGARQIQAWLASARARGLRILERRASWPSLLVAADAVLGDHGTTTFTAAALGKPVVLAGGSSPNTDPRSQARVMLENERWCGPEGSIVRQLDRAADERLPEKAELYAGLLTSEPGRSAELLRALIYRLLELPEPSHPAPTHCLPVPRFVEEW
ncbi:hypothetical protein IDM40_04480 [Nocardiopsis sp. HNM0947]|uniref:Uncharacterized protein n=1 Tax=Nocardiopsis coralli TaxID=2772213 RepID=A0ABR9P298_9ACTN|nr:hypothetical protein [Nocardiopsis coralli]